MLSLEIEVVFWNYILVRLLNFFGWVNVGLIYINCCVVGKIGKGNI